MNEDLKVKGSLSVVKVGTRVKNIRLVDGDHDLDCKIDGIGAMFYSICIQSGLSGCVYGIKAENI